MRQIAASLSDFAGDWRIDRQIEDRLGGPDGVFRGQASLVPDADGLRYEEVGLLTMGSALPMEARRMYFWRAEGRGAVDVFFDDGRPFHRFDLLGGEARHACPPDTYRVRYDFSDWPVWTARWRVTGPRKDYLMTSRYGRPG